MTTADDSGCALVGFDWHTQYYTNDSILVEEILVFDERSGTFEQTTTADSFQPCTCTPNWVDWRGDYVQANAKSLMRLTYVRCTQSAPGCQRCESTREVWAGVAFSGGCGTLILKHEDGDERRTYFAAKRA